MRLGIGSCTLRWAIEQRQLSVLELLDLAHRWGVQVVHLDDLLPLEVFEPARLSELRLWAVNRKLSLEVGARGSQVEHLRKMIQVARQLASPVLRVILDTAEDQPSAEQAVSRLCEVKEDLRAADVVLAIENHDRFPAESLAWILDQLDCEHVRICLNLVNALGVPEGPRQVLSRLLGYTIMLKLNDFVIHRAASRQGFVVEGRPAGEGMLDVPWVLNQLSPRQMESAIIELWTPPQQTMEQTLALERQWANRSVANVRKWVRA